MCWSCGTLCEVAVKKEKYCIKCGAVLPEEASFCPFCGKELNDSFQWGQFCPYCGKKVEK